jgi:hypothetical protein
MEVSIVWQGQLEVRRRRTTSCPQKPVASQRMDADPDLPPRTGRRLVAAATVPWEAIPADAQILGGSRPRPLVPVTAASLAGHGADVVVVDRAAHHGSAQVRADVLADLARRGVAVLLPEPLPAAVRLALGGPLADALEALRPDDLHEEDRVELAAAVARRRALLRGPSPATTILAATRRPARLPALAALLARQVAAAPGQVQVVVALHGEGFGPAAAAQVRQQLPDALVLACDARQPFGSVLQAASDRADGSVLAKVDDDDLYADDHVAEVAATVAAGGAEVAGRAAELVHLVQADITLRRRFRVTTGPASTVAGGTIAIRADVLAEVGGWPSVRAAVDRALLVRVRAAGGRVHRVPPFGYMLVRHGDAHTWQAEDRWFLDAATRHWRGCRTDVAGVTPSAG